MNPNQRFWRPTCYHYTILLLATWVGFEPTRDFITSVWLVVRCLQPLGHQAYFISLPILYKARIIINEQTKSGKVINSIGTPFNWKSVWDLNPRLYGFADHCIWPLCQPTYRLFIIFIIFRFFPHIIFCFNLSFNCIFWPTTTI